MATMTADPKWGTWGYNPAGDTASGAFGAFTPASQANAAQQQKSSGNPFADVLQQAGTWTIAPPQPSPVTTTFNPFVASSQSAPITTNKIVGQDPQLPQQPIQPPPVQPPPPSPPPDQPGPVDPGYNYQQPLPKPQPTNPNNPIAVTPPPTTPAPPWTPPPQPPPQEGTPPAGYSGAPRPGPGDVYFGTEDPIRAAAWYRTFTGPSGDYRGVTATDVVDYRNDPQNMTFADWYDKNRRGALPPAPVGGDADPEVAAKWYAQFKGYDNVNADDVKAYRDWAADPVNQKTAAQTDFALWYDWNRRGGGQNLYSWQRPDTNAGMTWGKSNAVDPAQAKSEVQSLLTSIQGGGTGFQQQVEGWKALPDAQLKLQGFTDSQIDYLKGRRDTSGALIQQPGSSPNDIGTRGDPATGGVHAQPGTTPPPQTGAAPSAAATQQPTATPSGNVDSTTLAAARAAMAKTDAQLRAENWSQAAIDQMRQQYGAPAAPATAATPQAGPTTTTIPSPLLEGGPITPPGGTRGDPNAGGLHAPPAATPPGTSPGTPPNTDIQSLIDLFAKNYTSKQQQPGVESLLDPMFARQRQNLLGDLNAEGAATGAIYSPGGFGENKATALSNLGAQQSGQLAGELGKEYLATVQQNTELAKISTEAGMQKYVADINADLERYKVNTNADLQKWLSNADNALKKYGIDTNDVLQRYMADEAAAVGKYSADASVSAARLHAAAAASAAQAQSQADMLRTQLQNQLGIAQLNVTREENIGNFILGLTSMGITSLDQLQNILNGLPTGTVVAGP